MDTLSRDSNSGSGGILPVAGLIAAAGALILAIVALVQLNKVKATVASQADEIAKIATIENEVRSTAAKSESDLKNLRDGIQTALNQVGTEMVALRAQVAKVEEEMKKKPAPAAAKGGAAAAPTGVRNADGTYTIAAGDTLAKVAKKFGVSLDSVLAENPGIEPSRLRVGQKIRLPGR
ncbi:MAG: LysM peptidoglycan-binding domain-containing protein [Candidatus Didemnitutus sp.]|nr:LysM peptidoglycan-binding domain-containing protein [Candidatus Didemnitutus sp.]